MSADFDLVLFFSNLAFNLILFGSVIALCVGIGLRLIKNAAPRLRYVLTVAAFMIASIVPLVLTFGGSVNLGRFTEDKSVKVEAASEDFFARETSLADRNLSTIPTNENKEIFNDSVNNLTAGIADSVTGKFLLGLWMTGAFILILRDAFALWRLRKAKLLWREAEDSECEDLNIPEYFRLFFADESPATIGLLRPSIVLPDRFFAELTISEKRFIIRHELSHARWRDPLVNFCLRLIRSLFWISPALWLLERIAVSERESAADRAAIADLSSNSQKCEEEILGYAATLVSIAKFSNSTGLRDSIGNNAVGIYKASQLENRIRRLLAIRAKTSLFRAFFAVGIFAFGFVALHFLPVAFQSERLENQVQSALISEADNAKSRQTEEFNNPSSANPPKIIEFGETNENLAQNVIPQPNEIKKENLARDEKYSQIPQVIYPKAGRVVNVKNEADDNETSLRKMSEEDARRSGFEERVNALGGEVENLNKMRKNLESKISQPLPKDKQDNISQPLPKDRESEVYREQRQKAAAQIDSLIRRNQAAQKPN